MKRRRIEITKIQTRLKRVTVEILPAWREFIQQRIPKNIKKK